VTLTSVLVQAALEMVVSSRSWQVPVTQGARCACLVALAMWVVVMF
jgi:hypothetical protein